jgi:cation diffusion facilitator family transporter
MRSHDHTFGQDRVQAGEPRTIAVAALTGVMMVAEVVAGLAYGSMALLADGLHMASHGAALGIAVAAYVYARRRANDPRFSFGTGKVNALGGFTSALLLGGFSLLMAAESLERLVHPVEIAFVHAIVVAGLGLVVNVVSFLVLKGGRVDDGHQSHDHNLRAASLHVLADALTSVLAIVALTAGRIWGATWLDPATGLLGSVLVARWGLGLARETGHVLLDHQASGDVRQRLREAIEAPEGDRVTDLHVWAIGPRRFAASLCVVSRTPRCPDHYRGLIPERLGIVHATVEVHRSGEGGATEHATRPR